MQNNIIDGKAIAKEIKSELKQAISDIKDAGISPRIVIVQIGDDRGSEIYAKSLVSSSDKLGIICDYHRFHYDTPPAEVYDKMKQFAIDPGVHGIIIQRPVKQPHSEEYLASLLPPEKDIDCMNPYSMGLLALGKPKMLPCTPAAIMELLKRSQVETSGRRAAIVGRSNVVGKPLFMLLSTKGDGDATVTMCHTKTKDLAAVLREMEIVISACGSPGLITGDMLSSGCVVIDAGINQVEDKIVGDVDFDSAVRKASLITPVPGGVGPVTRVMLFNNLIKAVVTQLKPS
ncbi:bifunctional 5,10-methylenetetrahydrofolate dehydrogenase/5,10-methenyltetrahydrofolate cyclohydrolase [bacterium]|nr:bifunctional 5,10-methylenetetrahydrofolate dehydrogenase/5,10-methenyltetrahydrofolate cyclohydrolase [bacterium]